MTRLYASHWEMPASDLGPVNPLPDLDHIGDAHAAIVIDEETVTPEEARYMGYARIHSILPYTLQDGYNREKKPKAFETLVLENDHIRATFLPSLGGRLWSLFDKDREKELLHTNPVFQPANLALRNAWFSGGIEWNCGIIGHTPFTCSDMACESFTLADGTPVLRMYQYERVRRLVYRLEAFLPEDAHQLYIRVVIHNPLPEDTVVYWWSNMAVNEGRDVRVIVPASKAFRYGYGGKLSKVPIPYMRAEADKLKGQAAELARRNGGYLDWDVSHSTCLPQSMDFFFDLPDGVRPFLCALDKEGYGVCQTSTHELRGRKLFVWGMGTGGRHWQSFLSREGSAYIELQSGLARTQLEHLPMPGNATVSWLEAYGPLQADPGIIHGKDYEAAVAHAENCLSTALPAEKLEACHEMLKACDAVSTQVLHKAPGFLALQSDALSGFDAGFPFLREAIAEDEEVRPWRTLFQEGSLPCPDPLEPPVSYETGAFWESRLRQAVAQGTADHWYGHYLLAVMAHARSDTQTARSAYLASLAGAKNPWAIRGLALLDKKEGKLKESWQLLLEAVSKAPIRPLAVEAMRTMMEDGAYGEMLRLYENLPESLERDGRLRVYCAAAHLRLGNPARAASLLGDDLVLADVREGETWLTDLWFELQAVVHAGSCTPESLAWARAHVSPPSHLDFRML